MAEGFVYVRDDRPGPMAGARVGARVRTPSWDPPWIVVDHELDGVIVARWPGRLFRVAVVPPDSDEERLALARVERNRRTDVPYSRVFTVDVLAELPPGPLFGPHGDAVVEILEHARRLTEPAARELAAARHPDADRAYTRVWQRWLDTRPGGTRYRSHDHSRVLSIPGAGRPGSPVGNGLTVLWTCVTDSARRCAGAAAFAVDEESDEEYDEVLQDPWSTAGAALLDAAMARGAPDLVGPADAAVLTAAWQVVRRRPGRILRW
ncbi:hypothetical protein [Dactylosporangium fulvum]|uniref:Uncharacterized protein n=1 Tax=Dactylosporangium fulvum TaxID=53359 RepID=A0ABY5WA95_9ACTN|nr:hypothetical protein [Dactylosporangium fulvum]UWP86993.1 hypothetical protein Dfulv_23230 [Dactylosporangium fulvum]